MAQLVEHDLYYAGVSTDELVHLLEEARDRMEYTPDREERELWKTRCTLMQEELLRRQETREQLEL